MSYVVKELKLNNFRSYSKAHIEFDPFLTILHGPNAAGKTNIIEALHLLTTGESFRKPKKKDLIFWGEKETQVELFASSSNMKRDMKFVVNEESKSTYVNGKQIKSRYEFGSMLPSVVFTPDDLSLIKEAGTRRRYEIDAIGSQLSLNYSRLVNEYKKICVQRNRILKDGGFEDEVFEVWTERLIEVGVALTDKRISLLKRIQPYVVDHYLRLVEEAQKNEPLEIEYEMGRNDNSLNSFRFALSEKKDSEKLRKQTLVGPHRDDIVFKIGGREARSTASQGQQRTIALSWKLAQLSVIEELSHNKPILLLDDVMSELDSTRRKYLTEIVGGITQTIITTANIHYFEDSLLKKAKVVLIPDQVT